MSDPRSPLGWPFLVARGRRVGYRSLLVPEFLVGTGDDGVLNTSVRGDGGPAAPARIDRIPTTAVGPMTAAYVTYRVTQADVAGGGTGSPVPDDDDPGQGRDESRPDDPGPLVTDRHSRPLEVLYGFVYRHGTIDELHEADLHTARRTALDVYSRFLDDEDGFALEASTAFPLRSSVHPIRSSHALSAGTSPTAGPSPSAPVPARRSPPEPAASSRGARTWNVVIGALAVALLAAVGKVLLASSPSAPPPAGSDIKVSGDRQCTLDETRSNSCVITLTVAAPDTVDLRSLTADLEERPGAAGSRDAWTVDHSNCQRPPDSGTCRLEIAVNPPTDPITEDLEAVLHITVEHPPLTQDVPLTARSP